MNKVSVALDNSVVAYSFSEKMTPSLFTQAGAHGGCSRAIPFRPEGVAFGCRAGGEGGARSLHRHPDDRIQVSRVALVPRFTKTTAAIP